MSSEREREAVGAEVEKRRMQGCCMDCGRKYGDEHGFPDLVVSPEAWKALSPTHDESGLLCPSCMCRRAHDAGLTEVPATFTSGPFRASDEAALLRAENVRLRAAVEGARDWAQRIAHDERVCGWVHGEDYSLYILLADCPVDFDAALAPGAAEEALKVVRQSCRAWAGPAGGVTPLPPAALAAAIAEGLGYTPGLGAHKHFAEKIAQIIARHMPAPATDGEVEAAATWLEGQAKGKRDFVAHAEANRDDWFATMPPEISEDALKEAAEMESAARLLRSLPALRAECAALRSAAEGSMSTTDPRPDDGVEDATPLAELEFLTKSSRRNITLTKTEVLSLISRLRTAHQRAAEAEAREAALRAALEPFAREADNWHEQFGDDFRPTCTPVATCSDCGGTVDEDNAAFTVGDLRAARRLFGEPQA